MSKKAVNPAPVVVWFREDLRLADQPALAAAIEAGAPVVCVYLFDETSPGLRPLGGASRWWLHHSLAALDAALAAIGGRLDILQGPALETIARVVDATGAQAVFWTRRYEAPAIAIDTAAKAALVERGIRAESFNGQLLFEPWALRTKTGTPFRVFTPFWRACLALPAPPPPLPAPRRLVSAPWPSHAPLERINLARLALLPEKPDWAGGLRQTWTPGEAGGRERLAAFIETGLRGYKSERDRPDMAATSRLSPHFRFGEISPRQALHAVRHAIDAGSVPASDADKFLAELGWREFSYHLLFHEPDLATRNFQSRFDAFPWRPAEPREIEAWRRGRTGYPIVDAGLRELWQTGTMHNRVRMIVASFLVKDLMVDWRVGESWFWDTLCDADPASNPASWQWVAGSGADAAPYFRVFNPVLQGAKFDPSGAYVRRYIPEIAALPDDWIHRPWETPPVILASAHLSLPRDYPLPIVDHSRARDRALAAFAQMRAEVA